MRIELSFAEIQNIIESKTGKKVLLSQVDNTTLNVDYLFSVQVPIVGEVTKAISIKFTIGMLSKTELSILYDGGVAINAMFIGALRFVENMPNLSFVEVGENRHFVIHLAQMEQLKEVFSKIDIQSIEVVDSGFSVNCKLKDTF